MNSWQSLVFYLLQMLLESTLNRKSSTSQNNSGLLFLKAASKFYHVSWITVFLSYFRLTNSYLVSLNVKYFDLWNLLFYFLLGFFASSFCYRIRSSLLMLKQEPDQSDTLPVCLSDQFSLELFVLSPTRQFLTTTSKSYCMLGNQSAIENNSIISFQSITPLPLRSQILNTILCAALTDILNILSMEILLSLIVLNQQQGISTLKTLSNQGSQYQFARTELFFMPVASLNLYLSSMVLKMSSRGRGKLVRFCLPTRKHRKSRAVLRSYSLRVILGYGCGFCCFFLSFSGDNVDDPSLSLNLGLGDSGIKLMLFILPLVPGISECSPKEVNFLDLLIASIFGFDLCLLLIVGSALLISYSYLAYYLDQYPAVASLS